VQAESVSLSYLKKAPDAGPVLAVQGNRLCRAGPRQAGDDLHSIKWRSTEDGGVYLQGWRWRWHGNVQHRRGWWLPWLRQSLPNYNN